MTVAELIKELEAFDKNLVVFRDGESDGCSCCSCPEDREIEEVLEKQSRMYRKGEPHEEDPGRIDFRLTRFVKVY
jgi:hypothetical protein